MPKTPEKNPGKIIKKRLKFPSVVSSEEYKLYLIKKEEEQEKKKSKKRTKPSENEAQAPGKPGKGKTLQKKKKVMDWTCKKCKASWNQEVKSGIPTKWIECETCMKWFHTKCISKKHSEFFGWNLNRDSSDSEEDSNKFICEDCVNNDSDVDFDLLSSSDEEAKK